MKFHNCKAVCRALNTLSEITDTIHMKRQRVTVLLVILIGLNPWIAIGANWIEKAKDLICGKRETEYGSVDLNPKVGECLMRIKQIIPPVVAMDTRETFFKIIARSDKGCVYKFLQADIAGLSEKEWLGKWGVPRHTEDCSFKAPKYIKIPCEEVPESTLKGDSSKKK